MHLPTADALTETLLGMAIHSLLIEAITEEQILSDEPLRDLRIDAIIEAVTQRPKHELLRGLPPTGASEQEEERISLVRLLVYDAVGRSAFQLERLSQNVRIVLLHLKGGVQQHDPTCADVIDLAS
jgi:hypothetical protein